MASSYTNDEGVFKNKFEITDAKQLKAIEYDLVARNAKLLLSGRVDMGVIAHDLRRLTAIHQYLFQDVYEWAGKLRTVPSSKRSNLGVISWFAEPDAITSLWFDIEQKCSAFADSDNLNFAQKVDTLAEIFIAANHIHPFPEGNGRSLQVFMKQLANEQGVDLDYTQVQAQEWNAASAVSGKHGRLFEHSIPIHSKPNFAPIKHIFSKVAKPIEINQGNNLLSKSLQHQWNATLGIGRETGKIIALSDSEVIQDAGCGRHVVWDRRTLQSKKMIVGESFTINENGKAERTEPKMGMGR